MKTVTKNSSKGFGKKNAKVEKAERAENDAGEVKSVKILAVKRTSKVRKGGAGKGRLYAAVPAKGSVKVKALIAKADDIEVPVAKIRKWIPMMVKNGFLAEV